MNDILHQFKRNISIPGIIRCVWEISSSQEFSKTRLTVQKKPKNRQKVGVLRSQSRFSTVSEKRPFSPFLGA